MRKHLLTSTAVAALAAGALTLAAPATAADWIDTGALGGPPGPGESVDVVGTGGGDFLAVWTIDLGEPTDDHRVYAARAVNGDWQSPVPLSPIGQDAFDVQVAANTKGDAVVTWEHAGGGPGLKVLSGRRLAGGSWGPVTNLVPTPSDSGLMHDTAIAKDGDAVVGYAISNGVDSTALVSDWPKVGSVTSSPIESGPDDEDWTNLAANADGDVLMSFVRGSALYATYRPAGSSGWTDAVTIIGDLSTANTSLALRPNGTGVVAGVAQGVDDVFRVVEIRADGTKGASTAVSAPGTDAGIAGAVTTNGDGDVFAVWEIESAEGNGLAQSVKPAGGAFSPATLLASPIFPGHHLSPEIALTDNGLRVVAASRAGIMQVWHRTSGFQASWVLHSAGPATSGSPRELAVDPEGNVALVAGNEQGAHAEILDAAGPVSRVVTPAKAIVTTDQLKIGWATNDSLSATTGITDVYATSAPWNAAQHTAPVLIADNATGTQVDFAATPGTTYCFQVRTQDELGNAANSRLKCASVPLDDRSLAGKGWTRAEGTGHFLGTVTSTTKEGKTLVRKGVRAKRLALVVHKKQNAGTVKVTFAGDVLGSFSLKGFGKRRVINLGSFPSVRTGTVKITVTSKGKPVVIDGLVVAK